MKTKAAVLYEQNKPLKIEVLSIPEIREGQVLVKIIASGICRTQLNEIKGKKGPDKYLPHTLGHEGAGIVEKVGSRVTKVKPGDHVVLTWIKGSGMDVPSTIYKNSSGATVNSGAISTFMEYAVISENRLVVIPNEVPLREASLFGCAIPTGAGIVMNTAKVSSGSSIAIFGMGGIGLSALLVAKLKGASLIVAIDIVDHKLRQALELGATNTINAGRQDVLSSIMEITDGCGVDFAIEAVGKKETMEIAFQAVRDNGGLCVLAGNLSQNEQISINPFNLIKKKKIVGTWGGETQPDIDIPFYVQLYLKGKLKIEKLITHSFSLDRINEAIEKLEDGKVGRIVIAMKKREL